MAARIMIMALTVLNLVVAARAANNGHAFDSTASPSFLQSRRRHHYNNNPSLFSVRTSKLFTSVSAETSTPSSSEAVNILLSLRAGGGNNDSNINNNNNNIQTITSLSQFQSILSSACKNKLNNQNQLVVLDFTSNNCPPCRMIAPIYEDLSQSEEFEERVIFCKVNVSDHPEVAEYYGVDGWPTFLLFKGAIRGDDDDGGGDGDGDGDGGGEVEVVDSIVGGQAAKAGLYELVAKHA